MSLTITVSCCQCDDEIDLETSSSIYCYDCNEGLITADLIRASLTHASSKDYDWDIDDTESDISYLDCPEKRTAYFNGIRRGYYSALFWIADYFGEEMVKFFEDEIENKFAKKEEGHEMV